MKRTFISKKRISEKTSKEIKSFKDFKSIGSKVSLGSFDSLQKVVAYEGL